MDQNYTSEVVIVGAGIAGITTALELLNLNKKVVLIDRDTESELGGLAKWAFGGMFFVDTPLQRRMGIKDSVDIALRDWHSVAQFSEKDVLPKAWAEQYVHSCKDHVYHWLKQHDVSFFPVVHWVERGLYKPGNSFPRFHMVWGTGHWLAKSMVNHLLNHPKKDTHLQIKCCHRVDEILVENNRITGVRGKQEPSGNDFTATGETTIVCTGGLGGNIKRVKENWYKPWGEPPEVILNGAHKYADGIVHDAVKKINGNITHLDKNWPYAAGVHHPRPTMDNHGLSLVPPKSALWLNYRGERFGPMPLVTGYDTRFLVEEICKQEKKYSWQILNMKIAYKEFAISGSESNEAIRDKKIFSFLKNILFGNKSLVHDMLDNCVDFITANSVEELVNKMNALAGTSDVDIHAVKEAVALYDAQIERGEKFFDDEQLRRIAHARKYRGDKVRTCKFQKIDDKKAYPLIAIREFILSRKTLGGIQTDLTGKVLSTPDPNGKQHTIDGLYAVGEAAGFGGGGIHGIGTLEGTFLGSCVLTGRIAAYDIAGKKLI